MKKIQTLALTFCAFIVAMACGSSIRNVRTRAANNGVSFTLNGMRSNGQQRIQIRNGNKYINQ